MMSFFVSSLRPFIVLICFAVLVRAERQAAFTLGDDTDADYFVGDVAAKAGLSVPSGGFIRVLIDRLPVIASQYFTINQRTELKVLKSLDRDKVCTQLMCCGGDRCFINFRVFITTERSSEHVQVSIHLRDENDNGPQFSADTISLLENTPVGAKKPLPKATDLDSKINGVSTYSLNDPTKTFSLVMVGDDPFIRVDTVLDRETRASYTLDYKAIDHGKPPRTGGITLKVLIKDVNDNAPKFEKREQTVIVGEDLSEGLLVAHLKTTDNDEGENGQVTYRLTADSTPIGLANTLFSVGATSGVVTVAKPLDFEDNRQASGFSLYVVAADKGKPPRSSTATLKIDLQDVNDNDPVVKIEGTNSKEPQIVEGDDPGKLIGTITVKDADEVSQGKVTCSLIHGNGFRLDNLSNLLLDVLTTRRFDHERESSVSITVECNDKALPMKRISKTFEIPVIDRNDNSPIFIGGNGLRTIKLSENLPVNREIIRLQATDADSGQRKAIRYSLDAQGTRYFSIHRDTGRVYLRHSLDREKEKGFNFTITATDGGIPARSTSVQVQVTVLDINDNAPRLVSPTQLTVMEGTPSNTYVGELKFEDPDFALNGTWSAQISPKANVANTMFAIVSSGGVTKIQTRTKIDRELHPNLYLEVIAYDNGSPAQSSTVVLTITIADRNDNAPTLITPDPGSTVGNSPPLYATAPWNTTVIRLRGHDPDKGPNGTFFFRLLATNATGLIGIEPQTGRIYTTWAEGKGRAGLFYFSVELQDRGTPVMRSKSSLFLHIGESGPLDRLRGAAVNNIVILALIIVCSVALAISLIVAIVWARSRISRAPPGDGRDPYADYEIKVPEESLSEHNMDEDENHHRPHHIRGGMYQPDGTFKACVPVSEDDYLDAYHHHCTMSRKDPKTAPMQTFSQNQYRSVMFVPLPGSVNGTLQRGPEQHRGPISPERIHLRRHSDASNEDSGKGGSDDNLSKCSISNPPTSVMSRPAMYVRRPNQEGTMC